MLLQRLVEYSERHEQQAPVPVMYDRTPVKWFIDLKNDGTFQGMVPTSSGEKKDRGRVLLAPTIGKTSGVRSKLLVENGEYVLALPRERKKASKKEKDPVAEARQRHQAFKVLVNKCAMETQEPSVIAIDRFLQVADLAALPLHEGFYANDMLTFRVEGVLPIDLPSVRGFWAREAAGAKAQAGSVACLVCGKVKVPENTMPIKVKRVPGGQSSGMAMVSTNKNAFLSFGLESALVSPICHECAEHHAKGANALMDDERTRIFLGPLVYVFWTKEGEELSFATLLSNPQPDDVKELLAGAFTGREAAVDEKAFYAAAFSASGGRVVVRDWLETTVPAARASMRRWFRLQQITENDGKEGHPLGLLSLSCAILPSRVLRDRKKVEKTLSPEIPRAMLHVALHGGALPSWFLFNAVKRCRAEQGEELGPVSRPRAALIKMVLLSQMESFKEGTMEKLDSENREPAYLCGRLLAVLESVQYAALGKTNTTVTSRFFGTASSAPASVFGRLLRGAQAHMGKMRIQKPGTYDALQRRLEEVTAALPQFPLVLDMQAQGLFALGYYHQKAADRCAREAYAEAKKAESETSETEQ